jgi:cyanophycin synthetase
MRAAGRLVRAVAAESGTTRLGVRVRPTSDPQRVVVAYPWVHRRRAEAMGRAVAEVLDALPAADVEEAVGAAAERVASVEPGPRPGTVVPRVPGVAVAESSTTDSDPRPEPSPGP